MPDSAEHDALGRGNIGVARPDDLGDGGDGLGAVGQRRDGLGAADAVDLVDAGEFRGSEHERRYGAAGSRHHHDDPRHAGDLGRHRVHQHRGRIGGRSARHVEPDRLDCRPARAEFDAERILEAVVPRQLAAVKRLDAVAGKFERRERFASAGVERGGDLLGRHPQAHPVGIEPIELPRVVLERAVAAGGHVVDDGAHRGVDVSGRFALGIEERAEPLRKIAGAYVEADAHDK